MYFLVYSNFEFWFFPSLTKRVNKFRETVKGESAIDFSRRIGSAEITSYDSENVYRLPNNLISNRTPNTRFKIDIKKRLIFTYE